MKTLQGIFMSLAAVLAARSALAVAPMEVMFDPETGGAVSLKLAEDPDQMNWIYGARRWGTLDAFQLQAFQPEAGGVRACYRRGHVVAEVSRFLDGGSAYVERYVFRNDGTNVVTFNRGDLAIATPFNDSYDSSEVCVRRRCHAHIWCGGEASYVHALKMGSFSTELALILTAGSLDSYSLRRNVAKWSNDRGGIYLHPDPFSLGPGEKHVLEWRLVAFAAGRLEDTLLAHGCPVVRFDAETVFPGEKFRLTFLVPGTNAVVETRREEIAPAPGFGPQRFEFDLGGRRARAVGYRSPALDDLVAARVRRILAEQQVNDPASQFDGAFVIYDYLRGRAVVENATNDHNAGRERVGMALLLARYLRHHGDDARAAAALAKWEAFLVRELWDAEIGWVYDNAGYGERLYNVPWVIDYWLERWEATREGVYLDRLEKTLRAYYRHGGVKHYPNAAFLADAVKALVDAGRKTEALRQLFDEHVENILRRGVLYPPHEVNFEQSIVSPAAHLIVSHCLCFGSDAQKLVGAKLQVEMLERFGGTQPHHRLDAIPVRHWDGFWFGARQLYGDVFPHYWAALSGNVFLRYAELTGNAHFRELGVRNLRNVLCNYRADGSATCAHLFPYSVIMTLDGERGEIDLGPPRYGEYDDEWANDQDFGLYLAYRWRDALKVAE